MPSDNTVFFTILGKDLSHINREFPPNPNELRSVEGQLLDSRYMSFQSVDSIRPHDVYCFEVFLEHVRVLLVFGRYVLLDRRGHGDRAGPAER